MTTQDDRLVGERYRLGSPVPGTGEYSIRLAVDEWSGLAVLMTLVPIPADLPADRAASLRRRVGREVAQATGVRHRHVGRVLGVVTDPATGLWVASETRAGFRTLLDIHEAEGAIAPGRVARWGSDLAAGLAALHEAGLTHRGVGAELVSVFEDGSAGLMAVAAAAGDGDGDGASAERTDTAHDAERSGDVKALASLLRMLLPPIPTGTGAGEPPPGAADANAVATLREALANAESDPRVSASMLHDHLARSVNGQPTSVGMEQARTPDAAPPPDGTTERFHRDHAGPAPHPAGPPPALPGHVAPPFAPMSPSPPAGGAPGGYAGAGIRAEAQRHPGPPRAALGPYDMTMVTPGPGSRSWISRHRAWVVAAVIVAVVAAVAAVTIVTSGASRRDAAAEAPPPQPAAAGPLGDPRTADPCSLLSAGSFRRFGSARLLDDYGPYYTCSVSIDSGGRSLLASVYLYAPGEVVLGNGTERAGDLMISRRPASSDGSCSRQIALPDGSAVQVRASPSGPPPADPCAVADAGTTTAVTAINDRNVARRAPDPSDELIGLDTCSLADPAAVGRIAGVNAGRITPGFGNFSCSIGYDPAFRNVGYAVYSANRLSPLSGSPIKIGRHSAVVVQYPPSDGYSQSCEIALVQRSYTGTSGSARVGLVEVKLYGSPGTTMQQTCDGARALAAATESRLPPPQ